MNTTANNQKDLEVFQQFARKSGRKAKSYTATRKESNQVVVYTRVSGKEQEKNMSLPAQKEMIEEQAKKEKDAGEIVAYFGGSYGAHKPMDEKKFQRMLDFIGKCKEGISQIMVYNTDRFSRTGAGARKDYRRPAQKIWRWCFSITQPCDTFDPMERIQSEHAVFDR